MAVIGEPIARVDEIISSLEQRSTQLLSADQTTQVIALGDKARDVRDQLLTAEHTMEEWLGFHCD